MSDYKIMQDGKEIGAIGRAEKVRLEPGESLDWPRVPDVVWIMLGDQVLGYAEADAFRAAAAALPNRGN